MIRSCNCCGRPMHTAPYPDFDDPGLCEICDRNGDPLVDQEEARRLLEEQAKEEHEAWAEDESDA